MTRFYVRGKSGIRETMGALTVALGIGGLSFYLVRILLARRILDSESPRRVASGTGRHQVTGSGGAR